MCEKGFEANGCDLNDRFAGKDMVGNADGPILHGTPPGGKWNPLHTFHHHSICLVASKCLRRRCSCQRSVDLWIESHLRQIRLWGCEAWQAVQCSSRKAHDRPRFWCFRNSCRSKLHLILHFLFWNVQELHVTVANIFPILLHRLDSHTCWVISLFLTHELTLKASSVDSNSANA